MVLRIIKFALKIWPMLIGVLLVLTLNRMEHMFDPVIRTFLVTELIQEQDHIIFQGYMRKVRDCQFAGVTATMRGKPIQLAFRDSKYDNINRPSGYQAWGPWIITIPDDVYKRNLDDSTIDLYQIHQCHPFWQTRSFLVQIASKYE